MEAMISGYGDGLIETPMAYCLPEKWARAERQGRKIAKPRSHDGRGYV